MLHYLTHSEIDKTKWDQCLEHSRFKIIYASSWYLDIISPNWDAIVEDNYQAIFPLTWKKKFGMYYLSQPYFAQQLGVFSGNYLSPEKVLAFLEAIPEKFRHFDITLNPSNLVQVPEDYLAQNRRTYHLALDKPYEEIAKNFFPDTKRNIKSARKLSLEIKPIEGEEIIRLYKENVWHKTQNMTQTNFNTLMVLGEELKKRSRCKYLGVFEKDQIGAAGMLVFGFNSIIFIFGSTNALGRKNASMRFLFDSLIREYAQSNLFLDFEGSSVESVAYFYSSFGSERFNFLNLGYSRSGALDQIIKQKQSLIRQLKHLSFALKA